MTTDDPDDAVIITLYNAAGEVTERHVITAKAHDGHPETCTMWCQECYFEACGAYETILGPLQ